MYVQTYTCTCSTKLFLHSFRGQIHVQVLYFITSCTSYHQILLAIILMCTLYVYTLYMHLHVNMHVHTCIHNNVHTCTYYFIICTHVCEPCVPVLQCTDHQNQLCALGIMEPLAFCIQSAVPKVCIAVCMDLLSRIVK